MIDARTMKTIATAMIYASCAIGAGTAGAQASEAAPGIQWRCMQEQDEDFNILCVPRRLGKDDSVTTPSPGAGVESSGGMPIPDTRIGSAEALPSGRDLRPLALRGTQEVFSASAWRLPLYRRPTNPLAVTRLLDTVLCGGVARCTVTYEPG
jgi:hypothetical protein